MWQEIAIIGIGILTIGYVGWKIYSFLTRRFDPADPCAGCNGCALKEEIQKNKKRHSLPTDKSLLRRLCKKNIHPSF